MLNQIHVTVLSLKLCFHYTNLSEKEKVKGESVNGVEKEQYRVVLRVS